MSKDRLKHLTDTALLRGFTALLARERTTTAELLAYMAEIDARNLYLPAGYPSMYAWCVGALGMSEDAACKRIQAARTARRFPAIFSAVADGRLHLSAVCLLAPHLVEENAEALLAAASHKSKAAIEQLLAERFPRPDLPALIAPTSPAISGNQLAPGQVGTAAMDAPAQSSVPSPAMVATMTLPAAAPAPPPRVTPLAPQRHGIQFTVDQATLELLRDVQALLGHTVARGDLAAVFHRALVVLKRDLERQKFAATDQPRPGRPRSADSRSIPAEVKRAVWKRDQGRCTFVSEGGHRCEERSGIEFDHIDAYALGGSATVTSIRLRCRAHNQYDAERTFGPEFMRQKRIAAVEARAKARATPAGAHSSGGVDRQLEEACHQPR